MIFGLEDHSCFKVVQWQNSTTEKMKPICLKAGQPLSGVNANESFELSGPAG